MTRLLLALALLPLLAAPPALAGEPAGGKIGYALGCALVKAADVEAACAELIFFKHEDERRIGEELGQLLDATQRARAVALLDAELAARKGSPAAGKDCPPSRPLCAFPAGALTALRGGLAPAK